MFENRPIPRSQRHEATQERLRDHIHALEAAGEFERAEIFREMLDERPSEDGHANERRRARVLDL